MEKKLSTPLKADLQHKEPSPNPPSCATIQWLKQVQAEKGHLGQLLEHSGETVANSNDFSHSPQALFWNSCSKLPAPQTGTLETFREKAGSLNCLFLLSSRFLGSLMATEGIQCDRPQGQWPVVQHLPNPRVLFTKSLPGAVQLSEQKGPEMLCSTQGQNPCWGCFPSHSAPLCYVPGSGFPQVTCLT